MGHYAVLGKDGEMDSHILIKEVEAVNESEAVRKAAKGVYENYRVLPLMTDENGGPVAYIYEREFLIRNE